ncbi:MAG: cytochrome c3 family protein [Desulfuromonadaceae bacterium]
MKRLGVLGTIFLLTAVLWGTTSRAEEELPETVVFRGQGKLGSVTFSHQLHTDQSIKSEMCHHTGSRIDKCASCHDNSENANVPRTQDAFHLICAGCHKYKRIDVSCVSCHKNEPAVVPAQE